MSNEKEYKTFLKNKRVAIIGPAKSATFEKNGSFIDDFDVVVRICNTEGDFDLSQHSDYTGSRTDVLYNVMDSHVHKLKKWTLDNKVKFLSTTYPLEEWFFHRMRENVRFMKQDKSFKTVIMPPLPYFSVKKATNSRPNSGFCAIIDLLSSDLKELYITGIDFYRSSIEGNGSGYISGYIAGDGQGFSWTDRRGKDFLLENISYDGPDIHNPDSSFVFFKKEMFLKDDRIRVDASFKKYLSDPIYESLYNFFGEKDA